MFEAIGITKSHGARKLFGPMDFRVGPAERIALVGRNGSGKSTLLRILAGEESPDGGEIRGRKGTTVGYLPQEITEGLTGTLLSFVEDTAGELKDVRDNLKTVEEKMTAGDGCGETLSLFGDLQARYEHLGGYRLRAEAKRILSGLGFGPGDFARELSSFSGGWRMRALLARILLKNPDVILLDEPTNHLDIVSLVWIEAFIKESPSAFVIVSHDVSFLDRIVGSVVAIEPSSTYRVKGGYADYVAYRDRKEEEEKAVYERKLRLIAEGRKFVDRFRAKNTKASQAQSRLKKIEKIEEGLEPVEVYRTSRPVINFPQPDRSGHEVVKLAGVSAGYGSVTVYENLDFTLYRGRKAAFIGPNGAGKSTFMKLLSGAIKPFSGELIYGLNVQVSYFSQHQMELLNPKRTVLEEILSLPGLRTEREARSLLGSFLFSGDDVEKRVEILSGGEKSRLVMAKIMTRPGNLLLMDEPTNHLDIDSCEVLKTALEEYEGTLVLITHDRDLINRVADSVVYVDPAGIVEYQGGYDDFVRNRGLAEAETGRQKFSGSEEKDFTRSTRGKDARRREAERRDREKKATGGLKAEVESIEREVDACHGRLSEIEELLASPEVYSDPLRSAALARERKTLTDASEELMEKWETASLRLHQAVERFKAEEDFS